MPDPLGNLSPEEVQKAIQWLIDHWGLTDVCPMHENPTQWQVGGQLVRTVPYGGPFANGVSYPLIPVICEYCGYTVFVNAIRAGLVSSDIVEAAS